MAKVRDRAMGNRQSQTASPFALLSFMFGILGAAAAVTHVGVLLVCGLTAPSGRQLGAVVALYGSLGGPGIILAIVDWYRPEGKKHVTAIALALNGLAVVVPVTIFVTSMIVLA